VAVLVVVLLLAGPALKERWARWRAENPWVENVPGVVGTVREMAGRSGERDAAPADTTAGSRASSRPLEGIDRKSAMPGDLPVWPRPKVETFNVGQGHAAAYQRVRHTPDSVIRYFRLAMPKNGWRLDKERAGAAGLVLLYRKDNRIARVEVVGDTAGTDIWLRSRAGASEAGR
jgi:hypothetical protein